MDDEERGGQDGAVAAGAGYNWRAALRTLSSEPLPPKLRETLVELGVHGHRLRVAVEAYSARVVRSMNDPEEREVLAGASRRWPESEEREAALGAYSEAKRLVAEMARAWVEGGAVPEDYGKGPGALPSAGVTAYGGDGTDGRGLALAVVAELKERFPGPCAAVRLDVDAEGPALSDVDAACIVRRYLSGVSLRKLSPDLLARFDAAERRLRERECS